MSLDARWENVHGYIGPPQGNIYEDEDGVDATKYTQFRIEVQDDKNVWYSNIIVGNDDLEDDRLGTHQFILDKMVKQVDMYMEDSSMAFYEERPL